MKCSDILAFEINLVHAIESQEHAVVATLLSGFGLALDAVTCALRQFLKTHKLHLLAQGDIFMVGR